MDIRHLTAALTRVGLRVAVEQNEEGLARISARNVRTVTDWARSRQARNAHTIAHLVERPLDQRGVTILAREIEDAQRQFDRDESIRRGRIPGGGLNSREVNMLIRGGQLGRKNR